MSTPLKVLIIEDNEDDAVLLMRELKRGGYDVTHKRLETADDLLRRAFRASGIWNEIIMAADGQQALNYLFGKAEFLRVTAALGLKWIVMLPADDTANAIDKV